VTIHRFQRIRDLRGDLSVGEFSRNVPFRPMRYFLVYDVPSVETRGEHAHRECEQFLTCVTGSVTVVVDDGVNREEILLDSPTLGLYIPPGVWAIQYKYSSDGVLLAFASNYYDPKDYIRNYGEYLREKGIGH
jgi:UDP-2-acetamido-3-amino-2,3-dideoxy-glucuronate N-acetyltransferase